MDQSTFALTSVTPLLSSDTADNHVLHKDLINAKLPVEIILSIFKLTCPRIWSRARLATTCRLWREITLKEASLWTYIEFLRIRNEDLEQHQNVLSLLTMQLGRTGSLPLDVILFLPVTTTLFEQLKRLFMEQGMFTRWRTLVLRMDYITNTEHLDSATFFGSDALPALESLTIVHIACQHTVETIRSMTEARCTGTPRRPPAMSFRPIDLTTPPSETTTIISHMCGTRLFDLSSLVLPNQVGRENEAEFLPANIVELECEKRSSHPFPYVESYKLMSCTFMAKFSLSSGSLVNLTVTNVLTVEQRCNVTLPALLYLSCGTISMGKFSSLCAPKLRELHLHHEGAKVYNSRSRRDISGTDASILSPGYSLYPRHSLVVHAPLPASSIIELLTQSHHVKQVSLYFRDERLARGVMASITGGRGRDHPRIVVGPSGPLCMDLSDLFFKFQWSRQADTTWMARAAYLVEKRKESGYDLKVYAMWSAEKEYTLMA